MRARSTSSFENDLRLLQALGPGDLQLLDGPAALQPRGLQRLLAGDVGALDLLLGGDLRLPQRTVGVGALHALGGDGDGGVVLSMLDHAPLLDLQHLADARRGDAFLLDLQFGRDALPLHGVAAADLGRLQLFRARDFELPRGQFRGDALRGDRLLLRDAGGLGRLAGRNLGLLQRPVALDLEPSCLLLAPMRSAFSVVPWAMRAFSTASRAAISASSRLRLRAISRLRTSCSRAMRSAFTSAS